MTRLSASSFKTYGDCPRKWYYEKVDGLRPDPGENLVLGSAVHAALEGWLARGSWCDPEVPAGWEHLVPRALEIARHGADALGLDADLRTYVRDGRQYAIELRVSRPAGALGALPFVGFVDWTDEGDGTVPRIRDHKTTKDLRAPWHHTAETLARDPQLLVYAGMVFEADRPPAVNVGHYYYQTEKGHGARGLSVDVPWSAIEETLAAFRRVGDEMAPFVEARPGAENVRANTAACGKYGGCPHASVCPASPANAQTRFGFPEPVRGETMSDPSAVLARLRARLGKQSNEEPSPADPPPAADPAPPAGTSVSPPDATPTDTPTDEQIAEAAEALRNVIEQLGKFPGDAYVEGLLRRMALDPEYASVVKIRAGVDDGLPDHRKKAIADRPASAGVDAKTRRDFDALRGELAAMGPGPISIDAAKDAARRAWDVRNIHDKRLFAALGVGHDLGLWDHSTTEIVLAVPVADPAPAPEAAPAPAPAPEAAPAPAPEAAPVPAPEAAPAPAPEATPAPAPVGRPIVYIGCLPVGGAVVPLEHVPAFQDAAEKVARDEKVPHYALAEYGKGPRGVVGLLRTLGGYDALAATVPAPIYVDPSHPCSGLLVEWALASGALVVRGVA